MKSFFAVRFGVAAAALFVATAVAGAQGPGDRPGWGEHRPPVERALGPQGKMGRWWNSPRMIELLKLTDDQRKSMDGILFEHREKLIDMRANVEKAELEMEPLMRDDQPNEAKILAQIDKVAQARAELEKANARFLLAIRAKLTPEQWKTLEAARGKIREHDREGWQGRGPDDGPGMHHMPPPEPGPQGPGPQSTIDVQPEIGAPVPATGAEQ